MEMQGTKENPRIYCQGSEEFPYRLKSRKKYVFPVKGCHYGNTRLARGKFEHYTNLVRKKAKREFQVDFEKNTTL